MKCPNCNKITHLISMFKDIGKCPLCAKKGIFTKEEINKTKRLNRGVRNG